MKKKLLSALLVATMSLGMLVGCGTAASRTEDNAKTDDKKVEANADADSADSEEAPSNGGETVTIICGYGAGGTADAIARKYALVANQNQSKYNFVVENKTGGDGFLAATEFSEEAADTKDLLVFGYGLCYRHDLGKEYGTEPVDFDRTAMRPIGTVDDRTWIVYANAGTTLADVLAKAKSEGIKMSGGNPLSDCHLELGSIIALEGGKVTVVSGYEGGAEQKKGLIDGEVDVFVGTTQAGKDEVEAGTLVPILAITDKAFEGFVTPDGPVTVPTVVGDAKAPELSADVDFSGCILPAGGTLATHADADQAFYDEMTEIMKGVWASDDYKEFIQSSMLNVFELYGQDAQDFMDTACENAKKAFGNLQ